jgi:hypothetical protein
MAQSRFYGLATALRPSMLPLTNVVDRLLGKGCLT